MKNTQDKIISAYLSAFALAILFAVFAFGFSGCGMRPFAEETGEGAAPQGAAPDDSGTTSSETGTNTVTVTGTTGDMVIGSAASPAAGNGDDDSVPVTTSDDDGADDDDGAPVATGDDDDTADDDSVPVATGDDDDDADDDTVGDDDSSDVCCADDDGSAICDANCVDDDTAPEIGTTDDDATTDDDSTEPPPPVTPPPPAPANLLGTETDGTLVTAPDGSTLEEWAREYGALRDTDGFELPIASGAFMNSGHRYTVEVFRKTPGEELLAWGRRTGNGDSHLSERTISTRNGKTGHVYSKGEEGLLPWIHVMVTTNGFVYRFEWTNPSMPRGETAEETAELLGGDRESYFSVPDHLLDFISETNVK